MNNNRQEHCIELLRQRGVTITDIAEAVIYLQAKYHPELTLHECEDEVRQVLNKHEVQYAVMLGIEIDRQCEAGNLKDEVLNDSIRSDAPLFGLDEVLAYAICNIYGSIALTNFGYIDKTKYGIIGILNDDHKNCNTFIDDIVGALAAAAASRIAHNRGDK
jgi:phosphatidylglycerophosphatase A